MKKAGKIIGVNLLILLSYTLFIKLVSGMYINFENLSLFIFVHFIVNLMKSSEKENRPSFLISAFLVLIIGFGTCILIGDGVG